MTDWESISSEEIPGVKYVRQRPDCAFALCALGWRDKLPVAPRPAALLEYRWRTLCEVWNKYADTQWLMGAMIAWAMEHREYETWLNGEML